MALTRRTFAGLFAAGSTAMARTTGFIEHRILKRPYSWQTPLIARSGYQWCGLYIDIKHDAPIRVIVNKPGMESLAEITVPPTDSLGPYRVQSVTGLDAGLGLIVRIESKTPFKLKSVSANFMIHSNRIKGWVAAHGESLGETSDMGPTWLMEEFKPQ